MREEIALHSGNWICFVHGHDCLSVLRFFLSERDKSNPVLKTEEIFEACIRQSANYTRFLEFHLFQTIDRRLSS